MCKAVTLFESGNIELNQKAQEILRELAELELHFVDVGIIGERFELPCIRTDEGERYFGIPAIEDFVRKQREAA